MSKYEQGPEAPLGPSPRLLVPVRHYPTAPRPTALIITLQLFKQDGNQQQFRFASS